MMYETNDPVALKRELLAAGDIATLRLMRQYEHNLRIYYKRRGEDVIRDREGETVELDDSLFEILEALQGSIEKQAPGELIRKIREGKSGLLIIELQPDAVFPPSGAGLKSC